MTCGIIRVFLQQINLYQYILHGLAIRHLSLTQLIHPFVQNFFKQISFNTLGIKIFTHFFYSRADSIVTE